MKSFIEYLYEAKIIDRDQLLKAVFEHISSMPSVSQIVYEENLLDPDQVLKILFYQIQFQIDFKQSCQDLQIWTPQLAEKINESIQKRSMPILEILFAKKLITEEQIAKLLDDFIGLFDQNISSDQIQFKLINEDFKRELITEFNDETKKMFDEHLFAEISKEKIHTMQGLSRLANAKLLENFLSNIKELATKLPHLSDEQKKSANEIKQSVINILWCLRDCIEETSSEENFWKDPSLKDQYILLMKQLSALRLLLPEQKDAA